MCGHAHCPKDVPEWADRRRHSGLARMPPDLPHIHGPTGPLVADLLDRPEDTGESGSTTSPYEETTP